MVRKYIITALTTFLLAILWCSPSRGQWNLDGNTICTTPGDQEYPAITLDGIGGAIITWMDRRRTDRIDIYVQRIGVDGNVLWEENGVPISSVMWDAYPAIIADGLGGAFISWHRCQPPEMDGDVYIQRIDTIGNILWTANGIPISTAPGYQWLPVLALDDQGGVYIAWDSDSRNVHAQRISGEGNILWVDDGVIICPGSSSQQNPRIIADGAGGAIIAWRDYRAINDFYDVYAQRIDPDGNYLWSAEGAPISTAPDHQDSPEITTDGAGGAYILWTDRRSGDYDIYAQRIDPDGNGYWTTDGIAICTAGGNQYGHQIAPDDTGGAIITWEDYRHGNWDVYAQRIDRAGNVHWGANGISVCTANGNQNDPQIVSNMAGGAIITWTDKRNGNSDIYAQRIEGDGTPTWPITNGIAICTATGDQDYVQIASDGNGGSIMTWSDTRDGNMDLYAIRITMQGAPVVTLLQSYSVSYTGLDIVITWTLSEASQHMQFFVLRAEPADAVFEIIQAPEIERDHLTFTFRDLNCKSGMNYRYRVEVEDELGRRNLFETEVITTPKTRLALYQNYPNPFNPTTNIQYQLPQDGYVKLDIFDVMGRKVICLIDGEQESGYHAIAWHGRDQHGKCLDSGTYFCRLTFEKQVITQKLIILR